MVKYIYSVGMHKEGGLNVLNKFIFDNNEEIYYFLDERLKNSEYLAGKNYSIADIATWPWIARHPIHDIGLAKYVQLSRWFKEIAKRPAVIKGYKFMDKEGEIPLP